MLYGLKISIIEQLNSVFAKYQQIDKVILYGSRAKGNFENGSDVDFAIVGPDINLSILHKVENEIDDLLLPYKFDISYYDHIKNKNLLDHINRVGVEFYVKNKSEQQIHSNTY